MLQCSESVMTYLKHINTISVFVLYNSRLCREGMPRIKKKNERGDLAHRRQQDSNIIRGRRDLRTSIALAPSGYTVLEGLAQFRLTNRTWLCPVRCCSCERYNPPLALRGVDNSYNKGLRQSTRDVRIVCRFRPEIRNFCLPGDILLDTFLAEPWSLSKISDQNRQSEIYFNVARATAWQFRRTIGCSGRSNSPGNPITR